MEMALTEEKKLMARSPKMEDELDFENSLTLSCIFPSVSFADFVILFNVPSIIIYYRIDI